MAWFLFAAYSKMWEEGDKLRELFSKKEPELEDMENSQAIYIVKNEKACSGENTKGVAGRPFLKRLGMWLVDPVNHFSRKADSLD